MDARCDLVGSSPRGFWCRRKRWIEMDMRLFGNSIITICISFLLFCNWIGDQDDKLSFTRTPYDGNTLKLNGYYYRTFSGGNIEIYFLFRNGNILYGTSASSSELPQLEAMFSNGKYYENAKNDKTDWGVFKIESNRVIYERWVAANGLGAAPVYRYTGTILNDTTFQMHSYCRVDGTDENAYNYVFKFKQFSPKPDSVTKFIP